MQKLALTPCTPLQKPLGYTTFPAKQHLGGGSYSLHFLTAILALLRGRCQGRGWWLQGTFGVSGKTTGLVGQVKFSGIVNALFSRPETQIFNFHKAETLTISQVLLDGTPGFDLRRTALTVAG
jgi:hypothetical protein